MSGGMTPAQLKVWACTESARVIVSQLTYYANEPEPVRTRVINLCIAKAEGIRKSLIEVQKELKK